MCIPSGHLGIRYFSVTATSFGRMYSTFLHKLSLRLAIEGSLVGASIGVTIGVVIAGSRPAIFRQMSSLATLLTRLQSVEDFGM